MEDQVMEVSASVRSQGGIKALGDQQLEDDLTIPNSITATQRSTDRSVHILRKYMADQNLPEDFENLSEEELDDLLSRFYREIRATDGEFYKKTTMTNIRHGINRFLRDYNKDILHHSAYRKSNETFKVVMKNVLVKHGKTVVKHLHTFTKVDARKLFSYLTSDLDNPVILQRKVFVDIVRHFKQNGTENLRQLKISDITVGKILKNNQLCAILDAQNLGKTYRPAITMCEIPGSKQCPIYSLMKYISHLNKGCKYLFQRPKDPRSPTPHSSVWYNDTVVGKNKFINMMAKISGAAGLSRRYTSYSLKCMDKSPRDAYDGDFERLSTELDLVTGTLEIEPDRQIREATLVNQERMRTAFEQVTRKEDRQKPEAALENLRSPCPIGVNGSTQEKRTSELEASFYALIKNAKQNELTAFMTFLDLKVAEFKVFGHVIWPADGSDGIEYNAASETFPTSHVVSNGNAVSRESSQQKTLPCIISVPPSADQSNPAQSTPADVMSPGNTASRVSSQRKILPHVVSATTSFVPPDSDKSAAHSNPAKSAPGHVILLSNTASRASSQRKILPRVVSATSSEVCPGPAKSAARPNPAKRGRFLPSPVSPQESNAASTVATLCVSKDGTMNIVNTASKGLSPESAKIQRMNVNDSSLEMSSTLTKRDSSEQRKMQKNALTNIHGMSSKLAKSPQVAPMSTNTSPTVSGIQSSAASSAAKTTNLVDSEKSKSSSHPENMGSVTNVPSVSKSAVSQGGMQVNQADASGFGDKSGNCQTLIHCIGQGEGGNAVFPAEQGATKLAGDPGILSVGAEQASTVVNDRRPRPFLYSHQHTAQEDSTLDMSVIKIEQDDATCGNCVVEDDWSLGDATMTVEKRGVKSEPV